MNDTNNDDVLETFNGFTSGMRKPEISSNEPLSRGKVLAMMESFNGRLKRTNKKLRKANQRLDETTQNLAETTQRLETAELLVKQYKGKNKKLKKKLHKSKQKNQTDYNSQSNKGGRWDGLIEKSVPKLIDFAAVVVDRKLPPPKGR